MLKIEKAVKKSLEKAEKVIVALNKKANAIGKKICNCWNC